MTAALPYITNIDSTFPTPGMNNNGQEFRDNYRNIKKSLETLDAYMVSLAAGSPNINAPYVTGTHIVSALKTLQLGTTNYITTGQMFDTVIIGQNPDGSVAAGSVAFFPNIIPISVQSVANPTGNFVAYNNTTGILIGATFTATNSGPYTVTGVSGHKIYTNPSPAFNDRIVYITNPPFKSFTVIDANTVSNAIIQAFAGDVKLTANDDSTNYTNGTLVVEGGVGISKTLNVHGDVNVEGDLTIDGTIASAATNVTFSNLTVAGNIKFVDTNNDPSPSVIMNTSTWSASFVANGGYQIFPGGMIWMWGTTSPIQFDVSATVTFPTIAGRSTPGFPNACMNAQLTVWNSADYVAYDNFGEIVSVTNTQIRIMNNQAYKSNASSSPVNWFAIGY